MAYQTLVEQVKWSLLEESCANGNIPTNVNTSTEGNITAMPQNANGGDGSAAGAVLQMSGTSRVCPLSSRLSLLRGKRGSRRADSSSHLFRRQKDNVNVAKDVPAADPTTTTTTTTTATTTEIISTEISERSLLIASTVRSSVRLAAHHIAKVEAGARGVLHSEETHAFTRRMLAAQGDRRRIAGVSTPLGSPVLDGGGFAALSPPAANTLDSDGSLRVALPDALRKVTTPTPTPTPTPEVTQQKPIPKQEASARRKLIRSEAVVISQLRHAWCAKQEWAGRKAIETKRAAFISSQKRLIALKQDTLPPIGATIKVKGLKGRQEYNGKVGTVVRYHESQACIHFEETGAQDFVLRPQYYDVVRRGRRHTVATPQRSRAGGLGGAQLSQTPTESTRSMAISAPDTLRQCESLPVLPTLPVLKTARKRGSTTAAVGGV